VAEKVSVSLIVRVLPSATVSVEPDAGVVIVTLLMVVAVATPSVGVVNVGDVSVLFVNVWVNVLSTISSLAAPGNVNVNASVVAENVMELLTESVLALVMVNVPVVLVTVNPLTVLPVRDSVPASVASVPVVGRVTVVAAPSVKVSAYAPLVVRFPPRVMVFPVLATPVPPYVGETIVPCHCPAEMIPVEAREKFGATLLLPTFIDPPVYQLPLVLFRSDTVCAAVQLLDTVRRPTGSRGYSDVDVPTR